MSDQAENAYKGAIYRHPILRTNDELLPVQMPNALDVTIWNSTNARDDNHVETGCQ
jgi:hypothetical protein